MEQLEKDIALLERYIGNDISEQEREEVNMRLVEEKQFSTLYQQLQELIEGIRRSGRKKLMAKMTKLETELPKLNLSDESEDPKIVPLVDVSHKKSSPRWWIGVAASLVLLATLAILIFSPSQQSMDELYAQHFKPYPNIVDVTTRGGQEFENKRKNALKAYDAGNYDQAVVLFDQIVLQERNQANLLYLGISQLMTNNLEKAVDVLEEASTLDGGLEYQIKWYLGLAYLRIESKEKAIEMFEYISKSDNSRNIKAKEILENLKD